MGRAAFLAIGVFVVSACEDPLDPLTEQAGGFFGVNTTGVVVPPGDTIQLHALAKLGTDPDGSRYAYPRGRRSDAPWPVDLPLRWWSSDSTTAAVTQEGVVEGVSEGRVVIWIESGSQRDSASVWVTADPERKRNYVMISARGSVTCALDDGGRAYCWGTDSNGGLGRGFRRKYLRVPSAAASASAFRFVDISASGSPCALTGSGEVYCWGNNFFGQLGDGKPLPAYEHRYSARPVRVAMDDPVIALGSSGATVCAVSERGRPWCWGLNLGGSADLRERESTEPRPIDVEGEFTAVSVSTNHACALEIGGAVYCWGTNHKGLLGRPPEGCYYCLHLPARVETQLEFVSIDVGSLLSCGLTAAGEVYCWGDVPKFGAPAWTHTPWRVPDLPALREISIHDFYGCGLEATGQPHCWGRSALLWENNGLDTLRFSTLSSKGDTICGVTAEGAAYCWGDNFVGQVGNGTLESGLLEPQRVVDW